MPMKALGKLILVLILAPLAIGSILRLLEPWPADWQNANWESSGIASTVPKSSNAEIHVYSARAGRWRGLIATHTWIAVKKYGEAEFIRYDVVGWGKPIRTNAYPLDGRWFGNEPELIFRSAGGRTNELVEEVMTAINEYPYSYPQSYVLWPGPNSNTFIAWIARRVPNLRLELPPTAMGKDYLGSGLRAAITPSGTGWQLNWSGLIGFSLSFDEGVELNILGMTIGIDFRDLKLKLPSLGSISINPF